MSSMPLVVYIDESGDHHLEKIDPAFPIFVLVLAVTDRDEYIDRTVPAFNRVKFRFFGSEAVIFHSYEIRKSRGAFSRLLDSSIRSAFLSELSRLMKECRYTLIPIAINKSLHVDRNPGAARNPYALALDHALERLTGMLEHQHQREVVLIAEKRGDREDTELRESFDRFVRGATSAVHPDRVRAIRWTLHFIPKRMNCIGHQIADLAGAPIAAHVLNTMNDRLTSDRAYEIVATKLDGPGLHGGIEVLP
jgi:hypothetical protein